MYPVTRPVLPDLSRYVRHLEKAHERAWLTNFGPLHEELTDRLKAHLGVENLLLVSNGTLALQVAYRALGLRSTAATTPFSFVATTSSLAWEGIDRRFVDIDRSSLNIDAARLSDADAISGVVAVHVYGNPCDVEAIDAFASARRIPVIYDAAHAFASRLDGRSILGWGDASTLSFHATKLFHTIEGGAIVFRESSHLEAARALVNFGQRDGEIVYAAGTNAKLSEYHAAVGLVLMDRIAEIINRRQELVAAYRAHLDNWVEFQHWHARSTEAGAYMPILLQNEAQCLALQRKLSDQGIQTRRYFHPSLNRIEPGPAADECPVSESIADRILCLPLYYDLAISDVDAISERVKAALS